MVGHVRVPPMAPSQYLARPAHTNTRIGGSRHASALSARPPCRTRGQARTALLRAELSVSPAATGMHREPSFLHGLSDRVRGQFVVLKILVDSLILTNSIDLRSGSGRGIRRSCRRPAPSRSARALRGVRTWARSYDLEQTALLTIGDFGSAGIRQHAARHGQGALPSLRPRRFGGLGDRRAEAEAPTMAAQAVVNTLWACATMGRAPSAGVMRGLRWRGGPRGARRR